MVVGTERGGGRIPTPHMGGVLCDGCHQDRPLGSRSSTLSSGISIPSIPPASQVSQNTVGRNQDNPGAAPRGAGASLHPTTLGFSFLALISKAIISPKAI